MTKASIRSAAELRQINRNRVFRYLYDISDPVTKRDIAAALTMSIPTVTQNLNTLMGMGLISTSEVADSTGGRKPHILAVVPDSRFAVGVELSAGHIRMAALNFKAEVLKTKVLHRHFHADEEYARHLAKVIEDFLNEAGIERKRLLGIGITFPGIVEKGGRIVKNAPTLGVKELPIENVICHIPYDTYSMNDANAGGYAEWKSTKDVSDIIYVSIGHGIGGAIVIDGVAYRGRTGSSGEFGHMAIHPGGRECACGRRGCLEAYCSTARLSDDLGITLDEFFDAVDSGEEHTKDLWETYLDDLAIGLSNISTAFDCRIVLGGRLSKHLEGRMAELERRAQDLDPGSAEELRIPLSRYHDDSNAIGAANFLIDRFIERI